MNQDNVPQALKAKRVFAAQSAAKKRTHSLNPTVYIKKVNAVHASDKKLLSFMVGSVGITVGIVAGILFSVWMFLVFLIALCFTVNLFFSSKSNSFATQIDVKKQEVEDKKRQPVSTGFLTSFWDNQEMVEEGESSQEIRVLCEMVEGIYFKCQEGVRVGSLNLNTQDAHYLNTIAYELEDMLKVYSNLEHKTDKTAATVAQALEAARGRLEIFQQLEQSESHKELRVQSGYIRQKSGS